MRCVSDCTQAASSCRQEVADIVRQSMAAQQTDSRGAWLHVAVTEAAHFSAAHAKILALFNSAKSAAVRGCILRCTSKARLFVSTVDCSEACVASKESRLYFTASNVATLHRHHQHGSLECVATAWQACSKSMTQQITCAHARQTIPH